jgi:tetratricopeptide (TPR) repeat protein
MTQPPASDSSFIGQFEPDLFWQEHGRKISFGIALIAVLGLAAFLWQKQTAQKAEAAATRLATAVDAISLQRFIQDYQGQDLVVSAMVRLGDLYFRDGRYAEAGAVYQKLLSSYPRHVLRDAANLGLAAVQEAQGNLEAAKTQYLQLLNANPSGYFALVARMGVARCAEFLGQTKEARQLYEEVLPLAQESQLQTEAYVRWTILSRHRQLETTNTTTSEVGAQLLPLNSGVGSVPSTTKP